MSHVHLLRQIRNSLHAYLLAMQDVLRGMPNATEQQWQQLSAASTELSQSLQRIDHMLNMQDILAKVTATKTVAESLEALLASVNAELKAAISASDPAQIQAVSDALDANMTEMQAAVIANTPAATPAAPSTSTI